jgi:hypothetical protein
MIAKNCHAHMALVEWKVSIDRLDSFGALLVLVATDQGQLKKNAYPDY